MPCQLRKRQECLEDKNCIFTKANYCRKAQNKPRTKKNPKAKKISSISTGSIPELRKPSSSQKNVARLVNKTPEKRNSKEIDFIIDPTFKSKINKKKAFSVLCRNPDAIHFIIRNVKLLNPYCWTQLSQNPSPEAIQLLRENFDKIDWYELSWNPCPEAIQLLRENPEKIN